eukprot:TRINITY_DN17523_c0_g1_i1.p1 TRINITY_DN17523_c0_g1~~TRINITY_DN17523_c0_g1_i1.p1  ORF type:complete len:130 (-),score=18.31 TRINITY_DN17523_c0_g1_i1:343-732(-)
MASFAQAALKRLKPLTDAASKAGSLVSTHGSSAYKGMMESNKQFIADPATPEKVAELTKKAFYTQLATIPHRQKLFWKDVDTVKSKWAHRQDLSVHEIGTAALFTLELYAWFVVGEIIGRGGTLTGYKV